MRQPFRVEPRLPVTAVKTYEVAAPLASHYRRATCAEVECEGWRSGWTTRIDTATELGAKQANYIRLHSGRAFTAEETGALVAFTFPPGQACFRTHHVPLERPAIYVVRDGDWRGNPRGTRRVHADAQDWVDDFGSHQQTLADRMQKG